MTVYSYSRINTYFTCPAQFQFRYIERRPSPAAEGIELFLGSRFHETMEFLYQQVPHKIPKVNQTLDYFNRQWETLWEKALQTQKERGYQETLRIVQEGQSVSDYLQKGRLFVENYYHQYHPFDQDRTEGLELKVAFNLDPQGQYKMQGYIDRLGVDDDGVLWIHDYKTSSRKMSEEDAQTEDQLALYQIGLHQNPKYGPKAKIKLLWHFVAFEKDQVAGERNPREVERLKERYISKIQTIEKAKSFSTRTGVLCQWCEYLSVCSDGKKWVEERRKKREPREGTGVIERPALTSQKAASRPESLEPSAGLTQPKTGLKGPATLVHQPTRRKKTDSPSPDQLSLFN